METQEGEEFSLFILLLLKKHDTGPAEGTGCVADPEPDVSETFGRTRFRLYDSVSVVYDVVSYHGDLG
jgi:hypothetical protein